MTVFVGELSGYVTEDELHSSQGSGKITCVKISSEEGCGFVKFEDPHACPKSPGTWEKFGQVRPKRIYIGPSQEAQRGGAESLPAYISRNSRHSSQPSSPHMACQDIGRDLGLMQNSINSIAHDKPNSCYRRHQKARSQFRQAAQKRQGT